jgi:hypothetical protein
VVSLRGLSRTGSGRDRVLLGLLMLGLLLGVSLLLGVLLLLSVFLLQLVCTLLLLRVALLLLIGTLLQLLLLQVVVLLLLQVVLLLLVVALLLLLLGVLLIVLRFGLLRGGVGTDRGLAGAIGDCLWMNERAGLGPRDVGLGGDVLGGDRNCRLAVIGCVELLAVF